MRRAFRRPVPMVVIALALVACVPLVALAASGRKPSKTVRVQLRGEQRVGNELVGERTRTSKTFVRRSGERVVRLYAGSMHYRDQRGRWREIDPTLQQLHGRLLNRRNSFSTSLPLDIADDTVRVRKGPWWLAFALRGAEGRAAAKGGRAIYAEAFPGVDVTYKAQRDSVKEDITLKGPESQRRFVFDLSTDRRLRPAVLRSGALALRGQRGRTRLAMTAPFMVDAKGRSAPVDLDLAKAGPKWRVTYTLDDAWLDRRGRAWPVTVDPNTTPNAEADCYLAANTPESSFCAATSMKVGIHAGVDHRVVMRFPLAGLPRGTEVGGATLVAQQSGEQTGTWKDYRVEPLTEPFTSGASWNRADGVDRWSEPGGEGDSQAAIEVPGSIGFGGGENYWTMMKLVRDWVAGRRPNHGVVMSVPGGGNGALLASSESATPPYLNVVIKERLGQRRGWVMDSQQITDRISLGVNVASGNLMVRQTDFAMPGGLGPAVSVSRTYNSLDDTFDALGPWSLDTGPDFQLEQNAGGAFMRLVYPTGAKGIYDRRADGTYTTPPGFNNTLVKDQPAAGKWELTDHASQTKFRFENYTKDGRLYEIEDRNGRKLTFVYNASDKLDRIEDSNNDAAVTTDDVRFTYTGNVITQMTDPAGRAYTYGYTNGYLTSYTDPQNGASFKTLYEYNGVNTQLSKITTPQGNITTIAYYPVGDPYEGKVKSVTRVTNTSNMTGPTTTYEYMLRRDGSGEALVTDAMGTASGDENDRVTRHIFDEQGRVTKAIDALGRETSRKITSNSNVESYSAASNGGTTPNTSFMYDGDDNPTRSDTPVGGGSVRACAEFGPKDPDPVDPNNPTSTEACDAAPAGYQSVPAGVSGSKFLPGRTTNPQGGRSLFTWQDHPTTPTDTKGNLYKIEQTTNGGSLLAGVSFARGNGSDGKPGRLNSITDHRGNTTSYGYTDGKGNVNTITPPNPGGLNPTGLTDLVYNTNLARLSRVVMPNETGGVRQRRNLSYDNLDRLTRIDYTGTNDTLDSGEPYVLYTYDRDGNQTGEESREQTTNTIRTRTMTYDKLNRVTLESLPGGVSNAYTYDAVGNLRSLTDAGGAVEYTYNAVNEIRALYEPGTAAPTKFTHTVEGQRDKTIYPNGVTIDRNYDDAFRLSQILSENSGGTDLQKLNYTYKNPVTNRQTRLIYEKTDSILSQKTTYEYDALDRLDKAIITPTSSGTNLATYDYVLDGVGNITSRIVTGTQAPNATTGYTYNSANELCQRQAGAPAASCPTTTPPYTYDKNGNQTAAPGRTATYNLLDQTTDLTISGSPTSLVYLGAGQDRWITEGTGSLQHNVLGVGKRNVGAATDYFTRDESGTLVSRRNGATRLYYLFDALGSVTGLTDSTGVVTTRHDYEPYGTPAPRAAGQWGATTNAADVSQGHFGFAAGYRSVGGLYHFGQRFYDPSDMRWTQPDPFDQTGDLREGNGYSYGAGDPVNQSDLAGLAVSCYYRAPTREERKRLGVPPGAVIPYDCRNRKKSDEGKGILDAACAVYGLERVTWPKVGHPGADVFCATYGVARLFW